MYLMLRKADAKDQPIRREHFVDLGVDLEFFPGVEDWFRREIRTKAGRHTTRVMLDINVLISVIILKVKS